MYRFVFGVGVRGLVICELRTGELVICELIVRTTDANLGYNANQKVRTFYAIKRGSYTCRNDFHNDSTCRKKPTQCTCCRNTTKLHLSVAAAIICTILGLRICLLPNQRINTAQKETHSKILPSLTYMEITKNSIGLSCSKGLRVCGTLRLSALGYRVYLTLHNCGFR